MGLIVALSRRESKARMNSAGDGPSASASRSIDWRTLATRPNASAAAQNPITSRSAGRT